MPQQKAAGAPAVALQGIAGPIQLQCVYVRVSGIRIRPEGPAPAMRTERARLLCEPLSPPRALEGKELGL